VKWRGRDKPERASQVAAEVERLCGQTFGNARVERRDAGAAAAISRKSSDGEPLLLVAVNGRGDVTLWLDNYESDDEWRGVIETLAAPRLTDAHEYEGGVHCFVIDGPGGTALFTESDERHIDGADTRSWLRALPGWSDTP
jgi:hypothetical protein